MTKEEAITFLKCDRERTCYDFKFGHCDGCNARTALDMAIEAVKAEPVKHGHWIAHDMSIKDVPTEACSKCCEWSYGYNEPYCQKCGAKMDEVEDGKV